MLEKTLESPLYYKENKPVHPKGNQSWIVIGRTDAPILWKPDAKSQLTGKDSDARKDWRQKKKGTTEDEMVKWHYWLDGREFEQVLGVGDEQWSLMCCSPWGSQRVRHDWATSLSLFTFMHWRRKWQPTPVLAWRIPGTGEPGGLLSMGSHRVGHDWSDLAASAEATNESHI